MIDVKSDSEITSIQEEHDEMNFSSMYAIIQFYLY